MACRLVNPVFVVLLLLLSIQPMECQVWSDGGIELVQGRLLMEYRQGDWRTVCKEEWDWEASGVACDQLSLGPPLRQLFPPVDSPPDVPILRGRFSCVGNERHLSYCPLKPLPGDKSCEHSDDVTIECTPAEFHTQVDNEDPVISNCPDTIFRQIPNGSPGETVFWTEPTATDNLDTSLTLVRSDAPGDFFIPGSTPVTYTFTDDAGRSATCSFSVFIFVSGVPTDNEDPVISDCPDSIVRQLPNGSPGQTIFWVEPTATDIIDTSLTLARSHASGDFFIPGNTPVTYTFTDDAGRSAMCSFSVFIFVSGVITDSTAPEITGCPSQPITRIISSALDSDTVDWMGPTATDDSGAVEIIPSHSSGDEFFVGTTEVTYTFRDEANNEADCSFDVIVEQGSYPCAGSPCPPELACFYSLTEFVCRERDGSLRRRREVIDAGDGPCPCQNGGSCHQDGERDGQYCACPPGYSGLFCQLN